MSWQEAVAVAVILLGLGAGAFLVAQRPAFWLELGGRLLKALLPVVIAFVTRRMDPAEEAEWRKAELQGRGDEWMRERWRKRQKNPPAA